MPDFVQSVVCQCDLQQQIIEHYRTKDMKAKNTKFCRLGPFPLTDRILSSSSCFGVFSVHLFTNFHPFLHSRALSGSRFDRHAGGCSGRVVIFCVCMYVCLLGRQFHFGPNEHQLQLAVSDHAPVNVWRVDSRTR